MKYNKVSAILVVALILSLLAVPILAKPAQAQSCSVSPNHGLPGAILTVSGWGFSSAGTIQLYYPDQNTPSGGVFVANTAGDFYRSWTIPLTGPGGSRTLWVKDVTANTFSSCSFTVDAKITLNSTSGQVGDEITFDGNGFAVSATVTIYFDDVEIGSAASDANGVLDNAPFTVPTSAYGAHTVKVQASATNYATATFTTKAKLTTISPTSGAVGDKVTVSGDGFKANQSVTIYFAEAEVTTFTTDEKGSFSGSFSVPVVASGIYKVKVSDGTSSDEADFTLAAGFSINPTAGNVGSEITASGVSFITGGTVTITYGDDVVATAASDTQGSFSVTFKAPASIGGNHIIKVTDGINTLTANFTMESQAPPYPTPLAPYMGAKAEALTSFDWEDVTDPSGVTYSLQISSDRDFNYLVLEKSGLESSGYTLTEPEKLESTKKEAPYYWRVQAVDGAFNESGWTTLGSFYVGFAFEFTGWVMWTAIGIGGLLLFFIGFWVGRRTGYY